MKKVLFIIAALAASFTLSCAGKQVPRTLPITPGVKIVIPANCDPITLELRDHIIARTDQFCKEAGRTGVKRLVICHNAADQATGVAYLCIGECSSIDDGECVPGQRRVTEEVFPDKSEVHYKTFLMIVLGH